MILGKIFNTMRSVSFSFSFSGQDFTSNQLPGNHFLLLVNKWNENKSIIIKILSEPSVCPLVSWAWSCFCFTEVVT